MRWIGRGPEPAGVAQYARQFTQGWIDYFQNRTGDRPTDHYWGEFRPRLGDQSNNTCWYCERLCYADAETGGRAPTVDHFRPISRFPNLVYAWTNWIFSCKRCNDHKADRWREVGYVDPCAEANAERPDQYFDYEPDTAHLVPKNGLSVDARRKAQDTINDLNLNRLELRWARHDLTLRLLAAFAEQSPDQRQAFVENFIQQADEHIGVTILMVEQLRQNEHI